MNDNWTLFANFGYSRQKLNQNVSPNMSSYWIKDDAGNYDFLQTNSATPQRSYYAQLGTKNKFETGALKHEVMLSADKAWRNRNGSTTVPGTTLVGGSNILQELPSRMLMQDILVILQDLITKLLSGAFPCWIASASVNGTL